MTEIGRARSGGDNQTVVRNGTITQAGANGACTAIDSLDAAQCHAGVPLATQNPADRHCNVRRRQRRDDDLIEQRLKEMEAALVGHRDQRGRPAQASSGAGQAAEAGTEDDDTR